MSAGSDRLYEATQTVWNPSLVFFRSGGIELQDYGFVTWSFHSIRGRLPFHFIQCKLGAFGTTAWGFGYAFGLHTAMCRAMGEAWERIWLLKMLNGSTNDLPIVTSSNGFAAGLSDAAAVHASRAELIERAVFLQAWTSMKGWCPHRIKGASARLLVQVLGAGQWRLNAFYLKTTGSGAVLACLIRHPRLGAIFDTAYVDPVASLPAIEAKAMKSLLRSAELARYRDDRGLADLPVVGKPNDHARYYLDPGRDDAFAFLATGCDAAEPLDLPEPDAIDTRVLFRAGQLPAVALSFHPRWPRLSWGRESITGINLWPHPLA